MPQIPGSRRVLPLFPDEVMTDNLRRLVEQDAVWITRARWPRWLSHGDLQDAQPIAEMRPDDRRAARAWLSQQRHAIHRVLDAEGRAAPDGWIEEQPLFRGLSD